jgi:DNA-binding transcriptional ArsR family regulator
MENDLRKLASKYAAFFSVFGNASRVLILWSLRDQERSVSDISGAIGASMQNTSQHLRLMKAQRIVQSRRVGQTIYYQIAENELVMNCPALLDPMSEPTITTYKFQTELKP